MVFWNKDLAGRFNEYQERRLRKAISAEENDLLKVQGGEERSLGQLLD